MATQIDIDSIWLNPISETAPCGQNLEYDADYVLLFSKIAPKSSVQYGEFSLNPVPPNWREIEHDCCKLLQKTKDINLLVILVRCRTKLASAKGLYETLNMLVSGLEKFPDTIYPQLYIDNEYDAEVRANSIAALNDSEGLISDIYDIVLNRKTAKRLTIRDVVRSLLKQPPPNSLPRKSVQMQLQELNTENNAEYRALEQCSILIKKLILWCEENLKDDAPDLQSLNNVLNLFNQEANYNLNNQENLDNLTCEQTEEQFIEENLIQIEDNNREEENILVNIKPTAYLNDKVKNNYPKSTADGRQNAKMLINKARFWFEENEPSSPISLLLHQAEILVGKKYIEIVKIIPPELLIKFEELNSELNEE